MRKASLLGCVSSPTSSDEPAPGRGEGKCGGSHLPGKHLGPPPLRPPLGFWAREPESAGGPQGSVGSPELSKPTGSQPLPWEPGQRRGEAQRHSSNTHPPPTGSCRHLGQGPGGPGRGLSPHRVSSPPAQRCRSPAEAFHTLLEGADLPPPGPGTPQLGRSGHSSRDRKSGSQVGAYAGVGPALEVLCPFLHRPLTSPT